MGGFKVILAYGNEAFQVEKIYIKILPGIPPNYLKTFNINSTGTVDGEPFTFKHSITVSVENNGIEVNYDSSKPFNPNEGDVLIYPHFKNYFPYWENIHSYNLNLVELSPPSIGELGITGLNNTGFGKS